MKTRSGTITIRKIAKGSKSERLAACLLTDKELYVFRIKGDNPFEINSILREMDGQKVKIKGHIRNYLLIVEEMEALDD